MPPRGETEAKRISSRLAAERPPAATIDSCSVLYVHVILVAQNQDRSGGTVPAVPELKAEQPHPPVQAVQSREPWILHRFHIIVQPPLLLQTTTCGLRT